MLYKLAFLETITLNKIDYKAVYTTIGFNMGTKIIDNSLLFLKNLFFSIMNEGIGFILKLIFAIFIIIIGKKLIRILIGILEKNFNRTKMEASVSGFLLALIRALLYVVLFSIIISEIVGIQRASVVALIGSAGLSIGLALQGSLSNFAGGVLILLLKPFRVGDYIISGVNEGTVTSIDIFYTRLLTVDNRLLVMPNGSLSNANIINVTYEPIRRLDIFILVDYSENIKKVKDILTEIAQNNEMVLKENDITVFVNSFEPTAINVGIRVWVLKENFWNLKCQLLEEIKSKFDENQVMIPVEPIKINMKKVKQQ
jgi:small conductance mechanosensitive channel